MAILSKAPPQPKQFRQIPNWASALLALKLKRIITSTERGRISESLRRALRVSSLGKGKASVSVPHYWAPFYHDGRGRAPRTNRTGKFMVWFKDPGDDPRWGPNLPVFRSEVRRLTKEEFQAGLEENRRRGPGNPFMIVAKFSPAAKANPFFLRALSVLLIEAVEVDGFVDNAIGDIIDRKLRHSRAKPFFKKSLKLKI